ncbi:ankyrin repeat-containing domain, PGG domain protein [Tanacetum coccineum]|uniref:Ankyrin repeat-containing domain, PGG domain protein n=1 Tax=Tanacetum coccineum TaxID=301880 RepID=A0ABQ5FFM7_9ASTR
MEIYKQDVKAHYCRLMEIEMEQQASENHVIEIPPLARSGPNLPCSYLLDEAYLTLSLSIINSRPTVPQSRPPRGKRDEYTVFGIPLYEASITADWKAAKEILDKKPYLTCFSITENCETALHVAASARRTKRVAEFVQNLVDMMQTADLELQNKNGNTALSLAAQAGNLEISVLAEFYNIIVKKNPALLSIPNRKELMPLYMAALFGNHSVVKYLFDKSNGLRDDDGWNAQKRAWLLQKCVEGDMFDIALQIVKDHTELASDGDALRILAKKPDAFVEKSSNFLWRTVNWVFAFVCPKEGHPKKDTEVLELLRIIWKDIAKKPKKAIDDMIRGPPDKNKKDDRLPYGKEEQQLHLLKLIADHVKKIPTELPKINGGNSADTSIVPRITNAKKTYSSRTLFIAAEMGNTKFIVELIRQHPDLIWKVNDDNQTIFHIAVKHRHEGIYNLLYEIGSMKDLITPLRDENDNSMLHLVGKSAKRKRLQDVSGVAFQMQRELLWFREVESMIPPSYRERKNKDGLTPTARYSGKNIKHVVVKRRGRNEGNKLINEWWVEHCKATVLLPAALLFRGLQTKPLVIPIFKSEASFMVFCSGRRPFSFLITASILIFLNYPYVPVTLNVDILQSYR